MLTMNAPLPSNVGGTAVGEGGERVAVRTMDSFGFENVALVKIDVEGTRTRYWQAPRRLCGATGQSC